MPKASVKKLIECKKEQLINLVLDIEKYPEFVPFCVNAKVYEKKEKDNLLLIIVFVRKNSLLLVSFDLIQSGFFFY